MNNKKQFGPQPWIFPNPAVLVGTEVDGKPNFAPYAWCGITGGEPPTLAVGIRHERYTLKGIRQNLECEVLHMLNVGIHTLVVAKIVETHVSEDCLTDGQPDIMKIKPFVYSRGPTARYNAVGDVLGQAFIVGKSLKKK
jgi:flavin reductase (DIM6/NTAB) family NADH-FMN oxidoreductase RutF